MNRVKSHRCWLQQRAILISSRAILIIVCFNSPTVSAASSQTETRWSSAVSEKSIAASESDQPDSDSASPFNEKMFWFDLQLDRYLMRPVASGYATVAPLPVRQSVGCFLNNVDVLPRVTNSVLQLRFKQAGSETARFAINTTLGGLGLFDVADRWFGITERNNDFGLTLRRYHVRSGPYLVLPFFGPSTVVDAVGMGVDAAMDPLSYLAPWYISLSARGGESIAEAVNYRSLNPKLFEEADFYALDLYGAVEDGYLQNREHQVEEGQ